MPQSVTIEQSEWITRIRLNRPERANALNDATVQALILALSDCYIDETKLVVLSGTGKHFCSGFDRGGGDTPTPASRALLGVHIETVLQLLWNAPYVTVACVHGSAVGGGADIVASCDYRLALPDTAMFFPGFRLMGVSLGNRRLAHLIGATRAIDLIARAKRIKRPEAIDLGLVSAMETAEESEQFVAALARDLRPVDKHAIVPLRRNIRGELPARPRRYSGNELSAM